MSGQLGDGSLRAVADQAMSHAYAPYSNFRVGAALRSTDGRVFAGSNVENASYGLGICAERAAVTAAVTAGARSFDALALVSDGDAPAPPCGACRQVLAEFAPELPITSYGVNGDVAEWTVAELLPHRFNLSERGGAVASQGSNAGSNSGDSSGSNRDTNEGNRKSE